MKTPSLLLLALCSLTLSFLAAPQLRGDTLAEMLEAAELGGIIGTWVDQDSNGEAVTVTYAWRVKDHALGMSVKTQERTSEALIGVNPKTGQVTHMSLDNKGGAGVGTWGEEDGVTTLTLKVVDAEKKEVSLKITHKLVDNKQLVIGMKNVENDEGGEITLVRKSE